MPDDIHALWMGRLERLAGGASTWQALEMAAILGRQVDAAEWREVCRLAGLDAPDRLRDDLVDRGLAQRTGDGWAFAHGLLVDSLHRRSRQQGHWQDHHHQAARLLETLYPDTPTQTAARRAHHWIEAGEFEQALAPLFEESEQFYRLGDQHSRRRVLVQRRDLLDALDVPGDDPRRLQNDLELCYAEVWFGDNVDAHVQRMEQVREIADERGDHLLASRAWAGSGHCARCKGEHAQALAYTERALEQARAAGSDLEQFKALARLGWTQYYRGQLDDARHHLVKAQERAAKAGERYFELHSQCGLAWVSTSGGDQERAAKLFEEVLDGARAAGFRELEAHCLNGLGDIARFGGDTSRARTYLREGGEVCDEIDDLPGAALAKLNLAQVELIDRNFDAAAERLAESERRIVDQTAYDSARLVDLVRVAIAAGVGDWAEFDRLIVPFEQISSEQDWPDDWTLEKDYPWLLEKAGDFAHSHGDAQRAKRAWKPARALWTKLGDEQAVAQLDERARL